MKLAAILKDKKDLLSHLEGVKLNFTQFYAGVFHFRGSTCNMDIHIRISAPPQKVEGYYDEEFELFSTLEIKDADFTSIVITNKRTSTTEYERWS